MCSSYGVNHIFLNRKTHRTITHRGLYVVVISTLICIIFGCFRSGHRAAEKANGEDNVTSVKDRVNKFEGKVPADSDKVVKRRAGATAGKKKKPKSKAFEEFENSGIIIGMVCVLSWQYLILGKMVS